MDFPEHFIFESDSRYILLVCQSVHFISFNNNYPVFPLINNESSLKKLSSAKKYNFIENINSSSAMQYSNYSFIF